MSQKNKGIILIIMSAFFFAYEHDGSACRGFAIN